MSSYFSEEDLKYYEEKRIKDLSRKLFTVTMSKEEETANRKEIFEYYIKTGNKNYPL